MSSTKTIRPPETLEDAQKPVEVADLV
jgi:putative transposase